MQSRVWNFQKYNVKEKKKKKKKNKVKIYKKYIKYVGFKEKKRVFFCKVIVGYKSEN